MSSPISVVVDASPYRLVPIDQVRESRLNPRKTFHQAKLAELARSIATHGLIQPLLVRPNGAGYKIAAGHRRERKKKAAKR